jgi:hypothetical protein
MSMAGTPRAGVPAGVDNALTWAGDSSILPLASSRTTGSDLTGGDAMTWETPSFVEIKMDAEINSYQDDFDREVPDSF